MIACLRAGSLLTAALAGRASEAERLELEDHLERCARCRAEHASLSVVRRLQEWDPPRLSDLSRERARRAVVAAGRRAVQEAAPATRNGRTLALGLLGGLAIAAVALLMMGRAGDRVVDGDVVVDGARCTAIGRGATLVSDRGGAILVGGAAVDLAAGSEVTWRGEARTVELKRGAVTVEVTPGQARRFRVATERFVVEVVGTHFTVDPRGVRTERGTVRVLSPANELLATVAAGQSWQLPPVAAVPTATAPVAAAPTAQPSALAAVAAPVVPQTVADAASPTARTTAAASPPIAGTVAPTARTTAAASPPVAGAVAPTARSTAVASRPVAGAVAPTARSTAAASPPVAGAAAPTMPSAAVAPPTVAAMAPQVRLAEARRAISAGQAERARALLHPLLVAGGGAEAHSLLAESYLVEARYDDAIAAYRTVARDFDGAPQAESALFAVAQLESESARPTEAARALTRYLARYPRGRFAREARRRLELLAH